MRVVIESWPVWTKLEPATDFIERVQANKADTMYLRTAVAVLFVTGGDCIVRFTFSSIWKSSTVAESPVVEVEESWMSVASVGRGGTSVVLSGKLYLESILAGVLNAFSNCSTKLRLSEAPDSLSMRISPVKSKDFPGVLVRGDIRFAIGEIRMGDLCTETGMGSAGRITMSARAGGREVSMETG